MARYQLRSPEQPFVVQAALGLFEFCSSLKLAVVLIFSSAAVLGLATFVESKYGTPAVQFGMYGTWWFTALNALLALSIFCAAAIRFPWKRHQTGFVITHIGLLTVLFGCLMSRKNGIDAQMPIFEGGKSFLAYEDNQSFFINVHRISPGDPVDAASLPRGKALPAIPFTAGPFNWSDYSQGLFPIDKKKQYPIPWQLAHRSQGVLFDDDGIKLEVLDYYSDCDEVPAPYARVWLSAPRMPQMGPDGRERLGPEEWVPVELTVHELNEHARRDYPFGLGDRQSRGGGQMVFNLAGSQDEVEAFLHSQPKAPLGPKGQIVLHAGGRPHRLSVEKLSQAPIALAETGFEVELVKYLPIARFDTGADDGRLHIVPNEEEGAPANPAVELKLLRRDKQVERMVLFADSPEFNIQAHEQGIYGSYWFDHGKKSSEQLLRGQGGSRIDVLQGPPDAQGAAKLYYRYWNRQKVVFARELPTGPDAVRSPVDAFKMPMGQLRMYADLVVPRDAPGTAIVPKKFNKDTTAVAARRAARVRLSVDDASEEFWIVGPPVETLERAPAETERRVVMSDRRAVSLVMELDRVDVGFRVGLNDFEMKLDPGTSQPSHYSSYVDLLDRRADKRFVKDEWITMNAPVDFTDPDSGRSYRLFQESFLGPWGPADPMFQQLVASDSDKDQLYASVLTVNFDPGRGVKYLGCLLVVAGIATMFYMRAYFFKRPTVPAKATAVASRVRERT